MAFPLQSIPAGGSTILHSLSAALHRSSAVDAASIWSRCVPVTADDEVASWLVDSDVDPENVASIDLARALPRDLPLPGWARFAGKPWNESGCRLIVPFYSAEGTMASLYARLLKPNAAARPPRSFPPVDESRGYVMANPGAVEVLESSRWPEGHAWRTVIIAGGAVDFLQWASTVASAAPAVFGLVTGSWTGRIASRIPEGSRVIVRAHANPITERYALLITQHLKGRCEVIIRSNE